MSWEKFLCLIGFHDMKWIEPKEVKVRIYSMSTGWYDSFSFVQQGSCNRKDCGYAKRRDL